MKKKFLVAGLSALLIFGIIAAANGVTNGTEEQGRVGFFRGFWMKGFDLDKFPGLEDLGLPEDATPQELRDALWEKRLSDLGLTEDSTIRELREAMEARRQIMWEERLSEIKEMLGLPEDASEEEVKEALKEKRGGCEGFPPKVGIPGKRMRGFPGL